MTDPSLSPDLPTIDLMKALTASLRGAAPEEVRAAAASPPTTQDREPFQTCGEWRLPKVGPTCWRQAGHEGDHCGGQEGCVGGVVSWPPPSSPTSEPIPASDQLREAMDELEKAVVVCARDICSSNLGWYENVRWNAARAAVEELFGAQQAEIERLRKLTEKEGWTEELWSDVAVLCQRGAFIAGAKWREIVSGISGDGIIRAEAESRYSISPESPATELASLRVERNEILIANNDLNAALMKEAVNVDRLSSELASLRSSALTAEEAELLVWQLEGGTHQYFTEAAYAVLTRKLKSLSALLSSTPDKGIG